MALRLRKPESLSCDCDLCQDIRNAAMNKGVISSADALKLQAHVEERANEVATRRMGIEMPKSVIALGMVVMLFVLGWYSWRADGVIVGAVLGLLLLVNGWTMGSSFVRVNERELRMRLEYENSELRQRLMSSEPELAGTNERRLLFAADRVIRDAKIRQEDLDGDENEDFHYEVPQTAMLKLSDAVEKLTKEGE